MIAHMKIDPHDLNTLECTITMTATIAEWRSLCNVIEKHGAVETYELKHRINYLLSQLDKRISSATEKGGD